MTRRTEENRCLTVEEWPVADQAAWAAALADPDPFESSVGYARRWKASTRRLVIVGYGRWLGWLDRIGELDRGSRPDERVSEVRLRQYLEALRAAELGDLTIANYIQQLGNALTAMRPTGDWSRILRAAGRIRETARHVKDQRSRMQSPEALLQFGLDLMAGARAGSRTNPVYCATDFRDGLLIALLVHRPMRTENVAMMRIGTHLRPTSEGWHVAFSADEMKRPRPYEFPWPDLLLAPLAEYLKTYRPILLRSVAEPEAIDTLFVSSIGRSFDAYRVGERVFLQTRKVFDSSVNAHLFRSIAASTIAAETPENIVDAARILGHASVRTTRQHYVRARQLEAGRALQRTVEAHRAAARRVRKKGGRPHAS